MNTSPKKPLPDCCASAPLRIRPRNSDSVTDFLENNLILSLGYFKGAKKCKEKSEFHDFFLLELGNN